MRVVADRSKISIEIRVPSKRKRMTLREIMAGMGEKLSDPTLRRDLEQLKRLGLVELDGFGRGAKWRLAIP